LGFVDGAGGWRWSKPLSRNDKSYTGYVLPEKVFRVYFEDKKPNGFGSILRCYQCVGSGIRVISVVILVSDAGALVPRTGC